jgi:hypothetical protein
MMPLSGLAVLLAGRGNLAGFVVITVVVAQGGMILVSPIAMYPSARPDDGLVLLMSFVVLPIQGIIATSRTAAARARAA